MIGFQMEKNKAFHSNWSDEEIAILRENYELKTSSQIACMLTGKSRNAVIGKAHRLGLRLPAKKVIPNKEKKPRNHTPKLSVVASNTMTKIRKIKLPTALPADFALNLGRNPIGIMELTTNTCRAPVGHDHKGMVTYCGEEVFPGKVWCPGHCVLFFRPSHERRSA